MKKLLFVIALCATAFTATGQENEGVTLTVRIENVLNDTGSILSALHTQETFMKTDGIQMKNDTAEKGELSLIFKNVRPGTYAVSVLHDENNNYRMDFEANGMPKENYAMSQNPMLMGPPVFNDVKFTVGDTDMDLVIRF